MQHTHHTGDEARRYPRPRRANLRLLEDQNGAGILNHIDDISANGVICHTVKPIPLMTKIGMALELPKPVARRVDAEGVVVGCDPDQIGDDNFRVSILFIKMEEADQETLQQFVDEDIVISMTDDYE